MDSQQCCPACQGTLVIRKGRTRAGVQKYHCLNADCPQPFFRAAYHTPHYATRAAYMAAYRQRRREQALTSVAPHVPCRQIGPHCTLYCCDWQTVYALLPRHAAVVSDPPYRTSYDYTKARRRPSRWDRSFAGADELFDPAPWLGFPEVILFGGDHFWDKLPRGGAWCCWDKNPGRQPADFSPVERIWLSRAGPPHYFPHLWCGGQRQGEENWTRLPKKLHPAQKPVALLVYLVKQTTAPLIVDPFMGSGTTLAACVRLGRPCIGIEIDEQYFAKACDRLQQEVEALGLFA